MPKLKTFLKRHVICAAMLAVPVPLLIILVVQYRSLSELEKALPMANRDLMRKYLAALNSKIGDFYKTIAEQTLAIPPDILTEARLQKKTDGILSYFNQHPVKGAKQLFVFFISETLGKTVHSEIYFYDPADPYELKTDPSLAQRQAAYTASFHYIYQNVIDPNSSLNVAAVNEQDLENRVITKPVLDSNSAVLGVAGMIVDETYFKEEFLPGLVQESLQMFFPQDYQDMIIILQDENDNRLFETQSYEGTDFEAAETLPYLFRNLSLRITMRSNSAGRGPKRLVAVNLSLSVVMTGLLVTVVYMALRTASREMKLSKMKSDFVSNVSHELRTPLASIRVFGEFFRAGWVDGPQKSREYGEYIENESRRLTHLINNILDFSKIESGGKAYEVKRINIKEIIDETLKAFEMQLAQSGFDLVLEVPEEPLPQAVINREAITQSLVNLIDNAIKYSRSSKKVLVRLGREEGYITISVTDYGVGIPRDEQQRIFDKFYRVGTGLVHDVKGTGLGLTIVKHIMDAHRGKITVQSRPCFGSTFTMHLPCDEALDENDRELCARMAGSN